jgi:hypothetical protein
MIRKLFALIDLPPILVKLNVAGLSVTEKGNWRAK